MTQNLNSQLDALQQFNLSMRRQLELAEAEIPILNDQIAQFARTGLLFDKALVGNILYSRAYSNPEAGSGGMLMQAALLVPGGFGLFEWDTDEYVAIEQSRTLSAIEARIHFRPFEELEPAFKALLLSQVEHLLGQLLTIAFPQRPEPPPVVEGWTTKSK
jgi:hypothetical protein